MSSRHYQKHFTPESANQTLPLVQRIVADIVQQYADIRDRKARLQEMRRFSGKTRKSENTPYGEEVQQIEDELEADVQRLGTFVEELHSLGIELKDFEKGLVDFPAIMDGREVHLCWFLGEPEVAHWHELDAGFRGRQSLMQGSATGTGESTPDDANTDDHP